MRAAPMQHSLFDSTEKQNSLSAAANRQFLVTVGIAAYSAGADGMPPYAGNVCASAGVAGAAFNICSAA
jgi:hypothetical protein